MDYISSNFFFIHRLFSRTGFIFFFGFTHNRSPGIPQQMPGKNFTIAGLSLRFPLVFIVRNPRLTGNDDRTGTTYGENPK